MQFPESDRVIYKQNPLVEVICQLRFPRILKIDSELPAAFQEEIRGTFPTVTETHPTTAAVPPEVLRMLGMDAGVTGQRAFDFSSDDGQWKLSLTSQFVALTSSNYVRWEDFKEKLAIGLEAFVAVYKPTYFSRLGLRYRDLIQRSKLNLGGQPWSKLLKEPLLGELTIKGFEEGTDHAARELVLRLDNDDAKVRLYHGFAKVQGSDETCYVIDADFFTEGRTEHQDATPILDRFNREAGRLFRWCIDDPLHVAMGPEPA